MANLDSFAGGVPAGVIFKMDSDDLVKIVDSSNDGDIYNRHAEISFIALICYFEKFLKTNLHQL